MSDSFSWLDGVDFTSCHGAHSYTFPHTIIKPKNQSALLSLIDGMPKWTETRSRANQAEKLGPDEHLGSTHDTARGIISFIDPKARSKSGGNKGKSNNKKRQQQASGKGSNRPSLIETEGVLETTLSSFEGKERDVEDDKQSADKMGSSKKPQVDKAQDKKRALVRRVSPS